MDDDEAKAVRIVALDDEQVMELIRGGPLMLTNALDEVIIICNNMTKEEIEEGISEVLGPENVIVLGRKLDG